MLVSDSAVLSVAKAASKALLPRVSDGLIGPAEERRLNAVCQKALRDVIGSYVSAGVGSDELDQVLEVLELTLQTGELDGRYLLGISAGGIDGASWRAAAVDAGYEPDQLALPVDEIMRRFAEELPSRLRREAASPDSPLFRLLALKLLDELAGRLSDGDERLATAIPIEAALRARLDSVQAMCRAADQPFRMPHMLLALLQDDVCKQRADRVRPGLAAVLVERLSRFVHGSRRPQDHYVDVDWAERDEVRRAQVTAFRNHEPVVMPVRMLYAALIIGSGTVNELRELLGTDFFWLLDALAEPVPTHSLKPTPGPVFGSLLCPATPRPAGSASRISGPGTSGPSGTSVENGRSSRRVPGG